MMIQPVRGRLQRHACLAAIACLHLAVGLMAWRAMPAPRPAALPQREGTLLLLRLPAVAKMPAPPMPPAQRQHPAASDRRADPATPAATPAAPPAAMAAAGAGAPSPAAPALPDDPFARPPAPILDTVARARLAAASVDRQLRKESLNKFASIVDEEKADRYSISGPAYRPPPPDESFADGRGIIHKRYMVRGKMVCETVDHVSPEAFQKGSQAHFVKCPK